MRHMNSQGPTCGYMVPHTILPHHLDRPWSWQAWSISFLLRKFAIDLFLRFNPILQLGADVTFAKSLT